jgi:very-short-patch-repair endonuclease
MCESPIEALFLAVAMTEMGFGDCRYEDYDKCVTDLEKLGLQAHRRLWSWELHCMLLPQAPVDRFRIDFAMWSEYHGWFAIELDGHDFHERTKAQASRDKAKDRGLVRLGFKVIRYTGSDVFRDPYACWRDVVDTMRGVE